MDLRDLIRNHPEKFLGHEPVPSSLNWRREWNRFQGNPCAPAVLKGTNRKPGFSRDEWGRFDEAYSWYTLCLGRCLEHLSTSRRAKAELKHHPGNLAYSPSQRRIAAKIRELDPYLDVDFQNLIIHACTMLDRIPAIARRSFGTVDGVKYSTFNQHLKSLPAESETTPAGFQEYTKTVLGAKPWFQVPIKVLRDKYVIHAAEPSARMFGWGAGPWDMTMTTFIPSKATEHPMEIEGKLVRFSVRRTARDVEHLLTELNEQFLRALSA